jgi:hypothetical protein
MNPLSLMMTAAPFDAARTKKEEGQNYCFTRSGTSILRRRIGLTLIIVEGLL